MSEETDGQVEAGAEAEASNEVESNSEATAEQSTGTEDAGLADDAGEATEEAPKRVPWFQKRIDEVTAKKYEAEREAAYWRGIAEGRTPQEQVQPQTPPDRWEDPEGYDRWLIAEATRAFEQRHQEQTVLRSFEERAAQFRASKPDFDAVVRNPSIRITPIMANVIRESEHGPQVAYHLGSNPAEADRIANLPEYRQAAELGRLEASLSMPQPAQQRAAPPPAPPKTLSGLSAGLTKSAEDMTMAEFIAARKAGTI